MSEQKPRQIAIRVLKQRALGQDYTENLFDQELAKERLTTSDRALCQELVYGIARWQATLDWLIGRKTENRAQKEDLQILLRLGLYQMFWLDRIPNHAAVHETVEIAKNLGFAPQAGFINAILRAYTRERVETEVLLADLKKTQPALGYSHPEWLCQRWLARWDLEKTIQLCAWNNTPPPTFARLNTLKTDGQKLNLQWEVERVKAAARTWDWTGDNLMYQLESHPPLHVLRSFREGGYYIQDPSTILAVNTLDPQPGESVLDLCAAPGGKTTFIAQKMQNRGRVIAQDSAVERLELIKENCVRLGVTIAEVSTAPSGILNNPAKRFDRILVDAPCSNTGVMRRRVDLRWRVTAEEISRLAETQLELLRQASPRLKPNGILVYSTCSLEPEENRDVVQKFLAEQPQFKLVMERELIPFVDGVDGAYVAKLQNTPGASPTNAPKT